MREHTPQQSGTPRDTDPLHEALQDHISKCDACRRAIDKGSPRGFAQRTNMCPQYLEIVELFAQGEFTRES